MRKKILFPEILKRKVKKKVVLHTGKKSSSIFGKGFNYFIKEGNKAFVLHSFYKLVLEIIHKKLFHNKKKHPRRKLIHVWRKLQGSFDVVRPFLYFVHKKMKRKYRKLPRALEYNKQWKFAWLSLEKGLKKHNGEFYLYIKKEIENLYVKSKTSVALKAQQSFFAEMYKAYLWVRPRKLPYYDVQKLEQPKAKKPRPCPNGTLIRRHPLVKDVKYLKRDIRLYLIERRIRKKIFMKKKTALKILAWTYKRYFIEKGRREMKKKRRNIRPKRIWIDPMELFFKRVLLYYERRKIPKVRYRTSQRLERSWRGLMTRKVYRRKVIKFLVKLGQLDV